jgi:alcohol dehydrogenase class IV
MTFEFATATRILFGPGTAGRIGAEAAALGRHALLVTGASAERAGPVRDALHEAGVTTTAFSVHGEPSIETVRDGWAVARTAGADVVMGLGGGSVVDTGKAVAALMSNGGDPLDYLEGIGGGRALTKPSAPYIAVPTTAGTGAEVTRNAVLASTEHRVKVSMRSPLMLPRLAVVDPELTYALPPAITATTGLDALTQLLEAFTSGKANPLVDGICREGLVRAARSLRKACHDGRDAAARADMALAGLFSGLALANAGLGAVHGFAGPLGGLYPAPHGAVCARLLPYVMTTNVAALRARDPGSPILVRYAEVAAIVTGTSDATAEDGVRWVASLCTDLDVPPLAAYGLKPEAFPLVCEKAARASSMKGNPIQLEQEELVSILEAAL